MICLLKFVVILAISIPTYPNNVPSNIQKKWEGVLERQPLSFLPAEKPIRKRSERLVAVLDRVQHAHGSMRYLRDDLIYGVEDYWATPEESAEIGGGDCEDIAIAKMYRLARQGIHPKRMVLSVVMVKKTREAHAVLIVDGWWVLDNNSKTVRDIYWLAQNYIDVYHFSAHK